MDGWGRAAPMSGGQPAAPGGDRMSSDNAFERVGFIGAGKMATALARGLCQAGFTTGDSIVASDVAQPARESFVSQTGARAVATNAAVLDQSDVVVLAVKPQHLRQVLE